MTVLLIDSERRHHDYLGRQLTSKGLSIASAAGAADIERCLWQEQVDLVVLNAKGHDCLAILRLVSQCRSELPVIVINAPADLTDRLTIFEAGATDCLLEPFSLGELLARIRAQLRRAAWRSD